jgi:hypothetical protein
MFKSAIAVIACAEPNTSYRNPISLEKMLLDICNAYWKTAHNETPEVLAKLESALPVEVHGAGSSGNMESREEGMDDSAAFNASTTKKSGPKGTGKAKKRSPAEPGNEIVEPPAASEKPKPKPRAAKKRTGAKDAPETIVG